MIFFSIGGENIMAKYKNVASDIIKRIKKHEFKDIGKLPTEDEMIEYYNVSRNTIRSALKTLTSQGVIYSRQGSGFYIRQRSNDNCIPITGTNGLTYDFPHNTFTNVVLSIELLKADEILAKKMFCEVGDSIYFCKRLRILDDKKFALEFSYYNQKIVPYLGKEIAEKSIYNYLQDNLKLKFGFADKHISAIKLNKEQAELLELETGDPGLVIADTVYLDNGMMFNTSQVIYNYKYANFYAMAVR